MRRRYPHVPGTHALSWVTWATASAALMLAGCAYVGPAKIEEKVDSLDHDGDGAPFGGPGRDCNDFNAEETPGKPEIPYDGWDNDCGGDGDLIDIDGDGFPGVSKAWYLENNPHAEWPAGMSEVVDCIDDPALHPRARDIYPGANDIPYDGIDSDCGGDTDFDVDGDGYMPDTFVLNGQVHDTKAAYEAYIAEWGYDLGPAVYGDCNDFEKSVNPGIPAEQDIWYDGVDSDCAGNNDFDQDGDGYMPDQALHAAKYATFVDQYHGGEAPWGEAQWGDCLDEVISGLEADPVAVYPGAADTWYDGIDSDCAGDNDFDQDLDGYMPDTYSLDPSDPDAVQHPTADAFATYQATWGTTFPAVFGDCNDLEPEVRPGALERFGDEVDNDCDGGSSTTPWGFANYLWTNPVPPKVVGTDTHYMVLTAAPAADFGLGTTSIDVGISMTFPRPDELLGIAGVGYKPIPAARQHWQGGANSQPLGYAIDAATTGPDVFAGVNYTIPSTNWSYVAQRLLEHDPGTDNFILRSYEFAGTIVQYTSSDLDVIIDDEGNAWTAACDDDTLQAMRGEGPLSGSKTASLGSLPAGCATNPNVNCVIEGPPGGICFFDGPPDLVTKTARIHLCEPNVDCETYLFDPDAKTLVPDVTPYEGVALTSGDYRDGWQRVTFSSGGAEFYRPADDTDFRVLGQYALRSFDAVERDDTTWFMVALIDVDVLDEEDQVVGTRPEILLAWGDPSVDDDDDGWGDMHTMTYPFHDPARPDLVPVGVAVHADSDRLALAVSAHDPLVPEQGAVGWAFLAWPEEE